MYIKSIYNDAMRSLFQIGQPYIHVSVIVYSSTIGEEIPFIPFNPKPSLRFKVSRLPQPRFGTDTALGKLSHSVYSITGNFGGLN